MKPSRLLAGALCLAVLASFVVACAPSAPVAQQPCPTQPACPEQPPRPTPEPLQCPTLAPVEPVECEPSGPASSEAAAAALAAAEAYMDAWESKDVEKFFSVHTEDATMVDMCSGDEYYMDLSRTWYKSTFDNEAFQVTFESYFISSDGRFALLEGMATDYIKDGKPVLVPMATILEIEDGKIIKRTQYHHGSHC